MYTSSVGSGKPVHLHRLTRAFACCLYDKYRNLICWLICPTDLYNVTWVLRKELVLLHVYEGWSKITEPYLITFNSSKMDTYFNDISSQLYVIYSIA